MPGDGGKEATDRAKKRTLEIGRCFFPRLRGWGINYLVCNEEDKYDEHATLNSIFCHLHAGVGTYGILPFIHTTY